MHTCNAHAAIRLIKLSTRNTIEPNQSPNNPRNVNPPLHALETSSDPKHNQRHSSHSSSGRNPHPNHRTFPEQQARHLDLALRQIIAAQVRIDLRHPHHPIRRVVRLLMCRLDHDRQILILGQPQHLPLLHPLHRRLQHQHRLLISCWVILRNKSATSQYTRSKRSYLRTTSMLGWRLRKGSSLNVYAIPIPALSVYSRLIYANAGVDSRLARTS